MTLNNGDNKLNAACWVPPIKTHPYLPACTAALINYAAGIFVACFMLRVDLIIWIFCLIVTIVEIHMLFLDVCVRLRNAID